MSVSVIIPTYNRADILAKVLPSYLQFEEVSEVLVVDDGSRDRTAEVVTGFAARDARVKLLQHPANRGMTFARNTGIENATGDLVLFSEDDLALAPGSLSTLAEHMAATGANIIAGRRIWMRIGESEERALARANSRRWPVVNRRLLEHYSHAMTPDDVPASLVNATMLVRREVLAQVQFANCYLGNAWREESDFQLTAQERGFKVVFCPHAIFYHYDRAIAGRGRNRLKSDLVYLYWIYRNNLTFLRRHREYLRREMPEALLLGSPLLTNLVYIVYRSALLTQTEVRRAVLSRRYNTGLPD
jgi:glycosyltransferase involved in cell wall biosynthesis